MGLSTDHLQRLTDPQKQARRQEGAKKHSFSIKVVSSSSVLKIKIFARNDQTTNERQARTGGGGKEIIISFFFI